MSKEGLKDDDAIVLNSIIRLYVPLACPAAFLCVKPVGVWETLNTAAIEAGLTGLDFDLTDLN